MADNRPFVDFKSIKQRVGIADVLARYGVNLVRVNQTAMRGACPLPSHSSGSKNTFYVKRSEIGLVLPFRIVQGRTVRGPGEHHRFRRAHGAVFCL